MVQITLRWALASVWFANGLGAKVLGLVPRHEAIVARILGEDLAHILTPLFGVGEIAIGIWIITDKYGRWCGILQIGLVALMNMIEFTFASDLLLWGRLNIVFAALFILSVYLYTFKIRPNNGTVR